MAKPEGGVVSGNDGVRAGGTGRLLAGAFRTKAAADPSAGWVETPDGRLWSRAQVMASAGQLAAAIDAALPEEAVIGLCDPYGPRYVAAFVACALAGRVAVPAPTGGRVSANDLAFVGVTHLLSDGRIDATGNDTKPWVYQKPEGFAVIVLTSGTTGVPHPIVLDDSALVWATWNASAAAASVFEPLPRPGSCIEAIDAVLSGEDVAVTFASTVGPDAVGGVVTMCKTLLSGGTLVVGPRWDVSVVRDLVGAGRVDAVSITPHDARRLLRSDPLGGVARLGAVTFGGAWVPETVACAIAERFGCVVASGYGCTELGGAISFGFISPGAGDGFIGSLLPSCEVNLAPAETGTLMCRTPASAIGRVNRSGSLDRFGDWISTGDVVERRDDSTMRVLGRADDVIIRAGRRIDPVAVEAVLEDHPGVSGAAVSAVRSRIAGEHDLLACCVAIAGPVPAADLRRWMAARVPPWSVPRRFEWVDQLPRTHDGAIRRTGQVTRGAAL